MKVFASVLTLAAIAAPVAPVFALPIPPAPSSAQQVQRRFVVDVSWHRHVHRYYPRYGGVVGGNGGYHVNRYGFGNYVSGPNGGFAGYPAGSAGARVYQQQQEWKCEAVPETC